MVVSLTKPMRDDRLIIKKQTPRATLYPHSLPRINKKRHDTRIDDDETDADATDDDDARHARAA